jgi:hypothetical protein
MNARGRQDMAEFRYYGLHDDGKIAFGEYVDVADLDAAIEYAWEACKSHTKGALRHLEVWSGTQMLYASHERAFSRTRLVEGDLAHARTCAGAGPA